MARPQLHPEEMEEFKERLCEVATRLLVQEGEDGLSMRRLSREVGCSHTKAYRYFASKEELLIAIRARAFLRYGAFLKQRLLEEETPLSRVKNLGMAYADYARLHEEEFRLMFSFQQSDSMSHESLREAVYGGWGIFLGAVKDAVASGVLLGEPEEIANVLWAGVHGVVTLGMSGKLVLGLERDVLVESMLNSLLRGYGAPG